MDDLKPHEKYRLTLVLETLAESFEVMDEVDYQIFADAPDGSSIAYGEGSGEDEVTVIRWSLGTEDGYGYQIFGGSDMVAWFNISKAYVFAIEDDKAVRADNFLRYTDQLDEVSFVLKMVK